MILRELNRRIWSILVLSFFLLSTNGIILFYHYCQHAHQMVFSMYIDSTQELCAENARLYDHNHESCCSNEHRNAKNCCKHHESKHKIAKLKLDFNVTDRQAAPKPIVLGLLTPVTAINDINLIEPSLFEISLQRDIPPETPLFQLSGKEILIQHHEFKIAC